MNQGIEWRGRLLDAAATVGVCVYCALTGQAKGTNANCPDCGRCPCTCRARRELCCGC